jgi:ankyrin repeat protein
MRAKPELDIFEATAAGNSERVAEILDRDARAAGSWSPDGFAALHFAAFFDRPEIARNLIRHGADIAAVSKNQMRVTPLHSAAAARSREIVRLLVENGAPTNAQQQGGWTALHAAAQAGDKEMVRTLLEYQADPLLMTEDGHTPVQMAQEKGHEEIVSLLTR